jgi:uncharacterized protein (TIGR02145 family)
MKKLFKFFTFILITATAFSQDLPTNIPTDGLALYYPFSANANDASGNQNHGIVTNAQLTADRFGNENSAYTFDGDDDYITSLNAFGGGQIPMTFSFWAKTSQANSRMSVMTQDCNSDESCSSSFGLVLNKFLNSAVVCNDGHMGTSPQSFGYAQPAHYGTVRTETANSGWNNYVLVIGSNDNYIYNNFKFYVNGSELQTNCDHNWDSWDYNFPSGFNLVIGKGNQTIIENFFDGEIDDVAIWNRALSNEEIYSLYDLPADILLNGTVSAENNQIKNVADPTDDQDAATKNYVDNNANSFSGSYNDLTDTPVTYTQTEVDDLIAEAVAGLQSQIDALQPSTTVTDIDGNTYDYLPYGAQVWTVENAEMVTYRDGTPIPQVTDDTEWENLTTGAWCYYNNDPTKGKLYNWYAVAGIHDNDPNTPNKELAPESWHVPTDAEWTTLEIYLITNGYNYDGTTTGNKIAKAMASTTGWNMQSVIGGPGYDQELNNSSGFNVFPEGIRGYEDGWFSSGNYAGLWTSTQISPSFAWHRSLYSFNTSLRRPNANLYKQFGFSVRFIRD